MDERMIKDAMLNEDENEIDLIELFFDFFKMLQRYWRLFLAIILVVTVGYSGYRYLTYSPIYHCEATFTVATANEDKDSGMTSYDFYYTSNTADQLSKTFPYILQSSYFTNALMNELETDHLNGTLSAKTLTDSNMVTMAVNSSDPQDALSILNGAIEIYPEVASFVLGDISFHMVTNAQLPATPSNQLTIVKTVGMGAGIGIIIGLAFIGCMALFKKTVKNPEQMHKITSLKCLAMIPKVKYKARNKKSLMQISIFDHRTSYGFKEGMRSLQIRLERLMKREKHKIILVTSSASGEGKSTLSISLAETFAANGNKVLLVDGDLRKPSLARMLGCSESKGLHELYSKPVKGDLSSICKVDKHRLYFIGNQKPEQQPVSVLNDKRLKSYLKTLKDQFDYVIVDTPPCGIFQDARMLQELADALIYVVKYDTLPLQTIQAGLSILRDDGCVMGYVFNDYSNMASDYGYGKYGYGYMRRYGKYGYGYRSKELR